jgi:hypothetical protein
METRRLQGDLIEVFKILKGMDNLDVNKFVSRQMHQLEETQ